MIVAINLTDVLQSIQLRIQDDEVEWALDKTKSFSTKSLYRMITHRGACVSERICVENKTTYENQSICIVWQLAHNKLFFCGSAHNKLQ